MGTGVVNCSPPTIELPPRTTVDAEHGCLLRSIQTTRSTQGSELQTCEVRLTTIYFGARFLLKVKVLKLVASVHHTPAQSFVSRRTVTTTTNGDTTTAVPTSVITATSPPRPWETGGGGTRLYRTLHQHHNTGLPIRHAKKSTFFFMRNGAGGFVIPNSNPYDRLLPPLADSTRGPHMYFLTYKTWLDYRRRLCLLPRPREGRWGGAAPWSAARSPPSATLPGSCCPPLYASSPLN